MPSSAPISVVHANEARHSGVTESTNGRHSRLALPYPEPSAANDVPRDIKALGRWDRADHRCRLPRHAEVRGPQREFAVGTTGRRMTRCCS
jgi:hypothetical protein